MHVCIHIVCMLYLVKEKALNRQNSALEKLDSIQKNLYELTKPFS